MTGRTRSLAAVIAAMVVVNLVYGLTLPLLSLVLDAQGISKTTIGMSIVAQASAGVLLAPFMSRLIIGVGAARVMQAATLVVAMCLVAFGLTNNILIWFLLRFMLGAAATTLWAASEAVINDLAEENWRGRVIAIYGSAGAAGFALGPLVLVLTGTEGMRPFAVTAAIIILASLPLFWLRQTAVRQGDGDRPNLLRLFKLVPHIMLLNLVYAATVESFVAFFPLFGIHIGLGEARSLSLLTIFALGGVFLQLPLGWLADHMPRQKLLLTCILMTIAGFLVFPEIIGRSVGGPVFAFTLGGVESMIYTLGIILLGQRFRGTELAAASVLFTGMWGLGMMIGPAIVGIGMDVFGVRSLTVLIAALYVAYLPVFLITSRFSRHSQSI